MPASFIGELILQPILEFIFQFVCYYIGRVIVLVFSLSRIKCDRITADTPRRKLRWGGLFHRRGQQLYLTAEATSGVGLLFVILLVAGGFLIFYLRADHAG
jgi:hypothetical protein